MQIQVLGTVDVLEPAGVAVGGPTQRRVLSALLLQPNQVVSIDQLVDCGGPTTGRRARRAQRPDLRAPSADRAGRGR